MARRARSIFRPLIRTPPGPGFRTRSPSAPGSVTDERSARWQMRGMRITAILTGRDGRTGTHEDHFLRTCELSARDAGGERRHRSYTPGVSGFEPIDEPADIVIMSSATDRFHSDASHVRGDPTIVNALLDVPPGEITGARRAHSRLSHEREPDLRLRAGSDANAMYLFSIGGVRVLHMGDVGNPIAPAVLEDLAGQVDVLLALAGAHATIALDDLDLAIAAIVPLV